MLNFAVIAMVCNSLGCYWVRPMDIGIFASQQTCATEAAARKKNSAMYFDTGCIVVQPNMDK